MTTEIKISDEARECAGQEVKFLGVENIPVGHFIQLLLDSRDAELQSLRRDKERLDWLNQHLCGVWYNGRACGYIVQKLEQTVGNIGIGRNPREAIDSAMSGKEGK